MAYRVQNIIIGAAALYVSAKSSADNDWEVGGKLGQNLPTFPGSGSVVNTLEAAASTWRHAGFTSEGIEVSYEPDFGEVEVDQLLDAAKMFKQAQRVMVNTTLTEATLENLQFVWGLPAETSTGATVYASGSGTVDGVTVGTNEEALGLYAGGLGDEPLERSLAFVGPSPRGTAAVGTKRERVYHIVRALQVESTSHALRRAEATTLPASFRVLPDPARSGAEYGAVRDRVITA